MPHVLRLRLTDAKSSHRDPAERQLTIANTQKTTDKGQEPRGSLSRTTTWGIGVLAAITKGPTRQGSSHKDLSSIWLLRNAVEGQSFRRTTFWEPLRVDFLGSPLKELPCWDDFRPAWYDWYHTTPYHASLLYCTDNHDTIPSYWRTIRSYHAIPYLPSTLYYPENHCTFSPHSTTPHYCIILTRKPLYQTFTLRLTTPPYCTILYIILLHNTTSYLKFIAWKIPRWTYSNPLPCLWRRRKKERYHVDKRISMR